MSFRISLAPFGIEFGCDDGETILDAAFRAGVNLRYGCRHGGCGACKTRLLEGDVDYAANRGSAISEAERQDGLALLCCAYPVDDVTVALDDYDEAELTPDFPPRQFAVTLAEKRLLTTDIMLVTFALAPGDRIAFAAGQYLEVAIPGSGAVRAFSFANAPADNDRVICMIKLLEGGAFGTYLRAAQPGETLRIEGPFGQFRVAETSADIVMIAGGSGMAPIVSMLADLAERGSRRNILFYYGARTKADLFWLDEIEQLGNRLGSFRFIPVLQHADDDWSGEQGLVTEVLARSEQALHRSEAYLCGPPGMIDAATPALRALGMFQSRIRFDKFVTTSSA